MSLKSICGVIISSEAPRELADFYAYAFDIDFAVENHDGLATHYGLDIGKIHLGIHPLNNMHMRDKGASSVIIAYNVASLEKVMTRLTRLGARQIAAPNDQGFGLVATYQDLDGNLFEVVELSYQFD